MELFVLLRALVPEMEADSSLLCMTTTLLTLTAAVLLLYSYAPYWGVRRVPGPPLVPLVGHLPLLAKHGPDIFAVLAKKHGPIFRFHLGRQPLIIIADPELCKEVAIKKFKSISNRSLPSPIAGSPLHQKGLFFTRDSRWSAMRNTIISLYQPSHLARLIQTMQFYINRMTENLTIEQEQEHIKFSDLSLKLATDIIGQTAFGVDFCLSKRTDVLDDKPESDEVSAFILEHMYSTTSLKMDFSGSFSVVLGLLAPVLQRPISGLLQRIPCTADWKIARANHMLTKRLNEVVSRKAGEDLRYSKDFLSSILNARESDNALKDLFTSDYISALAYEHLLAGSATTSFTLSALVYLVSQHSEVEKKLLDEIDKFRPADLVPSSDDLQNKFPYLDQVLKETMRFYPVSPLVARETAQLVELGGFLLPKGTWVWLAPGVMAKDPKHFPNPKVFRPERFDPSCEEEKCRHPYAHMPFGIGPRACIGQKFALQEIKLTVIHLYRNFIFRHSPLMECPLEFQYGIVLDFKYGVRLQAIRRGHTT